MGHANIFNLEYFRDAIQNKRFRLFFKEDYRLNQVLLGPLALVGALAHLFFYLFLEIYTDYYESLPLRLATTLLYASFLFLLPTRTPFNTLQKTYYELVLAFTLPFLFNFFLLKNGVNTYWSASVIFATIPYGLMSDPRKALLLYPLCFFAATVATGTIAGDMALVVKALQINVPGYFMVFLLAITQVLIKNAYLSLEREKKRSDELLHNILPAALAEKLRHGPKRIADRIEQATIIFADIAGFTSFTENMAPDVVVRILNEIYSHFDLLTEKYGVEKIKTMGDAYMAASGAPVPKANHAEAAAEMALEMKRFMAQFNAKNNRSFSLRIGMHSGPVVAGVIGLKKFSYDIWGGTVNLASRMESCGMNGEIQVSGATYQLIKDKYALEKRGEVSAKGIGNVTAYLLKGRIERPVHP